MAKGRKTGGKPFEKGNKANPAGRPVGSGLGLAKIRGYTSKQILMKLLDLLDLPASQLTEITTDPEAKVLDMALANVCLKAKTGDMVALNFLLERTYGKALNRFELSGPDGGPIVTKDKLSALSLDELKALRSISEKVHAKNDLDTNS